MNTPSLSQVLEQWLDRKRERRLVSIRKPRTSRFKYTKQFGSRGHFAVVEIRAVPASQFVFESHVDWPDSPRNYSTAVLDGILDELFASDRGDVAANVFFNLDAIEWHEVDSCATAFYHAARGAIREILGLDNYYDYNVEIPLPK